MVSRTRRALSIVDDMVDGHWLTLDAVVREQPTRQPTTNVTLFVV